MIGPSFYSLLNKPSTKISKLVEKQIHNQIMTLAKGMNLYDILTNMDDIQPQITLRGLLAIAFCCKSELNASIVEKYAKIVDVYDISMYLEAFIVDDLINGCFI